MIPAISFIIFLIYTLDHSAGLKWVPLKAGDAIPTNAISVSDRGQIFVGRARHYDEVLPAEVNSTFAVIESCGKNIVKRQYEVLVNRNNCRWQAFSQFENIPESIVRGGTAPNGEPIYVGKSTRSGYGLPTASHIELIYLTSKTKNKWSTSSTSILVCEDHSNWIDTASANIPNNTVYGGLSEDGNYIYVARLKSGCSIIPGQVTPELGVAIAAYKNEKIRSAYCQVLIGDTNEYSWATASNGNIPDYAVVGSKDKTGELMYVMLMNKTLGYLMPSTAAANLNEVYEILVKNVI